MKRINIRTAALSSVMAMAFDNTGWKMDGDKLAVDGNGNPIFINSGGGELAVNGDTISRLNGEAKTHREAKEALEGIVAKYRSPDGKLIDPEAARDAVDKLSKIDQTKLIDAGKVDELKAQMTAQFQGQLSEAQAELAKRDGRINDMLISDVFKSSEFLAENLAMPREFLEASMRSNFKVEDGKVVAYDKSGNPVYSKKNMGELASANEAIELLIELHPQKDAILKAPTAGGTGSQGGGGSRGRGRTMKRSEFDALPAHQRAETALAMGKGELTVVD